MSLDYSSVVKLRETIREVRYDGEEQHEGPLVDLANIFDRILDEWKEKGSDYVIDTYWIRKQNFTVTITNENPITALDVRLALEGTYGINNENMTVEDLADQ